MQVRAGAPAGAARGAEALAGGRPARRRGRASRPGARRARPSRGRARPSPGSRSPRSRAGCRRPPLGPARPRAPSGERRIPMSSPGCQRPPSSPNGEVTVPCAGHADQSGAGCGAIGARESARVTSTRASTSGEVSRWRARGRRSRRAVACSFRPEAGAPGRRRAVRPGAGRGLRRRARSRPTSPCSRTGSPA